MKEADAGAAPGTKPAGAKVKKRRMVHDPGEGASTGARQLAAAILEVLAGARTPAEAAQVLEMSLPRYYQLEARALHAMLQACEPRVHGRSKTAESALAALRRECEQLRRECNRQQALVREARRNLGFAAPAPAPVKAQRNGKKRRKHRPVVRALRAAERLKQGAVAEPSATAEPITP